MSLRLKVWSAAAFWLFVSACADSTTVLRVPTPDVQSFELTVYPILLRDCGFPACHGDTHRFFRVLGPGRTRALPKADLGLFAPATTEELTTSYQRARSMLAYEGQVEESLLLRKPLEAGHEGHDEWGTNVYRSADDPNYKILLAWARSTLGQPAVQAAP